MFGDNPNDARLKASWDNFCDELKSAGDLIFRDTTPQQDIDRAKGLRLLARNISLALQFNLENIDPDFPELLHYFDPLRKQGGDNTDALYVGAPINGEHTYRISGKRGDSRYFAVTVLEDGATPWGGAVIGNLVDSQIHTEPDGSFEIIMSSTPKPGNWLPMREDTSTMIARQTFDDRSKETPAEFTIECLSVEADNYLNPADIVDQLQNSAAFVKNTANIFVDWMDIYSAHINELPSDDQARCQRAGGDAAIHYLQSYWKLAPDEALVVHAPKIPNCKTWNFQLSNFWMESLDYRYYKISVNKHTASYNEDGSVTVVVAHQDPGEKYPNWLHTTGHDQGGNLWRWVEADEHPPVHCKVVKFADL